MLRREPTKVELTTDDIKVFDQARKVKAVHAQSLEMPVSPSKEAARQILMNASQHRQAHGRPAI